MLDRSTWPIDQLAAAQAGRLSREVGQASVRGNRTDQLPKSDIGEFRPNLHTAHYRMYKLPLLYLMKVLCLWFGFNLRSAFPRVGWILYDSSWCGAGWAGAAGGTADNRARAQNGTCHSGETATSGRHTHVVHFQQLVFFL